MHLSAAKRLAVDDLVDGRLDDRRPSKVDPPGPSHHHDLVRECGNIRTACRAAAEHRRYLRQSRRRHPALLKEGAAEMIAVWEDAILLRQIGATAIHQIDARQPVLEGNLLHAEVLLYGLLEERASLHGRIVGNDRTGYPGH